MKFVLTGFKMTTIEMLEKILKDINNIGGVETSAIASRDGLLICSTITKKEQVETFVAMSATMIGAAETATMELGKGIPDRIIVESKRGRIIGTGAGPKALLLVMTKPDASLGLVLIEMTKASEQIKEVLS
jgi:predicted regulator of Ras-like GTPase activity (Roadblock/LC7/MglB family)